MTEERWWNARHSSLMMIGFLRESTSVAKSKIGRRKLRLFACGGCRLIWDRFRNVTWRSAVEIAERFSDDLATKKQLNDARDAMTELHPDLSLQSPFDPNKLTVGQMAHSTTDPRPVDAASLFTAAQMYPLADNRYGPLIGEEALCRLVRCIFANCLRANPFDPRWLSSTVLDLAHTIYEERLFERLPILADALMDAGCDSEEIIKHCHSEGPHVRGCRVVDLLLGKE